MGGSGKADLALIGGKVITVNRGFEIAQAVAVKNGRIVVVGADSQIKPLIAPATQIIDLAGQTLLPGINDSHLHAPFFGATRPPLALDLSFPQVRSIPDIVEAVRRKATQVEPGKWIRGFGWDQSSLQECRNDPSRLPRRTDIDPVSPNNPVILTDFSGHTILVNGQALQIAGISRESADPPTGEMERGADGEPTGIFKELGAQTLVTKHVPLLSRQEKKTALLSAIGLLNSEGVTSITDAAIGPGGEAYVSGVMSAEFLDIYQELLAEGRLSVRVTVLLLLGEYGALTYDDLKDGLQTSPAPASRDKEWLQFPGVKIFADGIPLTYTSWMNEDYSSGQAGHGVSVIPGRTDAEQHDNLVAMIRLVHEHGFQIGVHATGDRAIDASVDGLVAAMKERPRPARHYIIHADFISPKTCRRLAGIGGGVAMQPTIEAMISDFEPAVVGQKRAAYEWPMRTAIDAGLNLTLSSDAPVTVPNWRLGVENAVLRESLPSGTVSGPEECITVKEAIRGYTINAAWQDGMESIKGSIEAGKAADFCLIDQDILSVDPREIRNIKVLKTIVGGKVVFQG